MSTETPPAKQRIDKWLWHARVVRTRGAAAALANAGYVRLNGDRVDAASRPVRLGDVVTVALDRSVRVMRVMGFSDRRGSADAAGALYAEVADGRPGADHQGRTADAPSRNAGAGRPTKRDRRTLERFLGSGED